MSRVDMASRARCPKPRRFLVWPARPAKAQSRRAPAAAGARRSRSPRVRDCGTLDQVAVARHHRPCHLLLFLLEPCPGADKGIDAGVPREEAAKQAPTAEAHCCPTSAPSSTCKVISIPLPRHKGPWKIQPLDHLARCHLRQRPHMSRQAPDRPGRRKAPAARAGVQPPCFPRPATDGSATTGPTSRQVRSSKRRLALTPDLRQTRRQRPARATHRCQKLHPRHWIAGFHGQAGVFIEDRQDRGSTPSARMSKPPDRPRLLHARWPRDRDEEIVAGVAGPRLTHGATRRPPAGAGGVR